MIFISLAFIQLMMINDIIGLMFLFVFLTFKIRDQIYFVKKYTVVFFSHDCRVAIDMRAMYIYNIYVYF